MFPSYQNQSNEWTRLDHIKKQLFSQVPFQSHRIRQGSRDRDIPAFQEIRDSRGEAGQKAGRVALLARVQTHPCVPPPPLGREQAYLVERDGMSLVGTAEVPVTAYHSEEILDEAQLPRKYVALSTCFRREAGAAGKDTYGLYRVHLFDKVEQVIVGPNDVEASKRFHLEILRNAEDMLQALGLPYRVVNVCTGDLGQGQVQKFDIETWMPSRNSYGETHSASRFYEFQARRLNIRYRDKDGNVKFCHTLNNTVIASPRVLIPVLEMYQNADGSITVPKALRPYMHGMEKIAKKT